MTAYIFVNGEVITITEALHRFAEKQKKEREEKENDTPSS